MMNVPRLLLASAIVGVLALALFAGAALAQDTGGTMTGGDMTGGTTEETAYETGNVIFIHPDGTGLNHWNAGRMYWEGPDGLLERDQLPEMAVHHGHMLDRLTGTSNGGATVHAFGYKVLGPGSFGQDGGGERFFLPEGTPMCEGEVTPDCAVHVDSVNGSGPAREDGRNLVQEAADLGYTVLRTRDEFEDLMTQLEADETLAPMVIGLFHADDIFNDEPEEVLISTGLVEDAQADAREGRLIVWGSQPDTLGYNPPTVAEMMDMALMILDRRAAEAGQPFYLVAEVESTDNVPNNANSIGMLRVVRRADDLIGATRTYVAENPNTLIVTAADSDGGAPQVFSPAPVDEDGNVTTSEGNPTGVGLNQGFPLDGIEGQNTPPFISAPDTFGNTPDFAIGYPGSDDVAGAIVSRAEGLNAELLSSEFAARFDSTDVYRMQYVTLFGELLPASYGEQAPARGEAE